MKTLLLIATLLSVHAYGITLSQAPKPQDKKAQTKLNLYVYAKDLVPYLHKNKKAILLDVRTPEELAFTGSAIRTNIHVPLYLIDQESSSFNHKKNTYGMMQNRFAQQVQKELTLAKAKKNQEIFVMCRSGHRSAKAVNILAKLGYTNVYTVLNGFEGHPAKKGNIGARTVNGWKNVGGAWSYKLNPKTIWFDDKYDE